MHNLVFRITSQHCAEGFSMNFCENQRYPLEYIFWTA